MSEEAVRQTRSQKRALEREAAPQSVEPSVAENDSKKPKLDLCEPPTPAQTCPKADTALEDSSSRTSTGSEQERGQNRSPSPVKDDVEQKEQVEPSPDNRTECNDRASRANTEPGVDTRSRVRLSEPKASGGLPAAGEVKATIKVEVQTGEQPVDMSTSRG